ncbi:MULTISPECIES: NepR family anti-sigma factor [Methylobacterium]|nr:MULTISPECIES: NepR family anti-sigma factor [Methylobacterium]
MDHVEPQNNRGHARRRTAAEGTLCMPYEYEAGAGASGRQNASAVPETGTGSDASDAHEIRLSDQAQRRIGAHLRSMYESMMSQPVPEKFRALIERLDETKG